MEKIFFIILRSIKWDETFNFIFFFKTEITLHETSKQIMYIREGVRIIPSCQTSKQKMLAT